PRGQVRVHPPSTARRPASATLAASRGSSAQLGAVRQRLARDRLAASAPPPAIAGPPGAREPLAALHRVAGWPAPGRILATAWRVSAPVAGSRLPLPCPSPQSAARAATGLQFRRVHSAWWRRPGRVSAATGV